MQFIFSLLAVAIALAISFPLIVFAVELVCGLKRPKDMTKPNLSMSLDGIAVLIPAHNEAGQIAALIEDLDGEIPLSQVYVVADNCNDDTADRARGLGVNVLERQDATRRGKGFALDFGRAALAESPPDAVLFLDADCRVEPGTIGPLVEAYRQTGHPQQAEYQMRPHPSGVVGQKVSAFAFFVINTVRQRGLSAVGAPARINGTGMLIPFSALGALALDHAHLAEDLEMGLELATSGNPAAFTPGALVWSTLPGGIKEEITQRQRWERGSDAARRSFGSSLAVKALKTGPGLAFGVFDLFVPPTITLLAMAGAGVFATFLLMLLGAASWPFAWTLFWLSIVAVLIVIAALCFRRETEITMGVGDVIQFALLKAKVLKAGQAETWVRTGRDDERSGP